MRCCCQGVGGNIRDRAFFDFADFFESAGGQGTTQDTGKFSAGDRHVIPVILAEDAVLFGIIQAGLIPRVTGRKRNAASMRGTVQAGRHDDGLRNGQIP